VGEAIQRFLMIWIASSHTALLAMTIFLNLRSHMITLLWIISFIALMSVLAYKRATLSVWTIAILFFLIVVWQFSHLGVVSKIILIVTFFALAILLNIRSLRCFFITKRIFNVYQTLKPALSTTEKQALAVGTVGWESELFSGMPHWKLLKQYPAPQLTPEEQAFLDEDTEQLCQMLDNWDISHYRFNLSDPAWQFIKDRGFLSFIIPKRYGGKEFSALAHTAVLVKIAGRSNAAASVVGVPNSLGPGELLLKYGTEEQKNYYLPRLARGEDIPCFALTSPDAGSDAGSMTDYGIVCKGQWQGQEILGMRLRWNKRYITLAPVATLLGLAFKLSDPEHLLGEQEDLGITCALIPVATPGVEIGRRHFPANSALPNGPTQGKDVFIPLDYIIGGVQMAGKGWQMLMECLATGRCITLPSVSTGSAKVAAFATGAYTRLRKQFHVAIGKFEGIEEALARIAGNTYLMDATLLFGVAAVDKGEHPAIPSAISKYNVTELGRAVINDAMDVHGGKGICMGPRNYLAQTYMEVPIGITVEGANILTRCMIIFGQGMMRCHPYLLEELTAAQNSDLKQGLKDFDKALFKHLGFVISNKARAFLLGITGGALAGGIPEKHPVVRRYYQQFSRFSAAFALTADMSVLSLGGEFKRREHLSGRLADVLSGLYMGSAVLKYFTDHGSPEEDLPLLEWSCQTLLFKMQTALDRALNNFPKPFVGSWLRLIIFPLGRRLKEPDDTLSHKVSVLLSSNTQARSRLTAGAYITSDSNNAVGLVGDAFIKTLMAEDIEKRIQNAVREAVIAGNTWPEKLASALTMGLITAEENNLLKEAEAARKEVVAVDDFSPEDL